MQTFLPFQNFKDSAIVLDYRRLGNQRNEALVCYRAITGQSQGTAWKNHPCVKMWTPYPDALALYFNTICRVWENRGYINNMPRLPIKKILISYPKWLGDPAFHSAHRAALLYKLPEWYTQFGWEEIPKIDYIWPSL
jgi:hypothetical protein